MLLCLDVDFYVDVDVYVCADVDVDVYVCADVDVDVDVYIYVDVYPVSSVVTPTPCSSMNCSSSSSFVLQGLMTFADDFDI